MSLNADVEGEGSGHCPTVMLVHDYTELLCKAGLMVALVKAGAEFCRAARATRESCSLVAAGGAALRNAPMLAYIAWPGAQWVASGDGGSCGKACVYVEACMEHACCLAVLLALAAVLYDSALLCVSGSSLAIGRCCMNCLCCEDDLEDHLSGHIAEKCVSEKANGGQTKTTAKQVARLAGLWSVYLGTAGLYVAITWGGWAGAPEQAVLFRCLDTACHAGLFLLACKQVLHWLLPCSQRRVGEHSHNTQQSTLLELTALQDLEAPPPKSSPGVESILDVAPSDSSAS